MLSDDLDVRYAESGDAHIAYTTLGKGALDLTWVIGGNSALQHLSEHPIFGEAVERLASFSRLILFDHRGAGLSDPVAPQSIPTLEERADEMRAVLDAASSTRTVILGSGVGGPVAMMYAATYPNRVTALILHDTYARFLRSDDYPQGITEARLEDIRDATATTWGSGASLAYLAPSVAHDAAARRRWGRIERESASPAEVRALMEMWFEIDVRDLLSSIQAPTLVVHRRDDQLVRIDHGRYLVEHIPGARLIELAGRDHFWNNADERELLVGEIEEFVTGTRPGPVSDRVLATVLFTDIVDSTAKAAAIGDRDWRELLDRHDEVVRRQLDRHRGVAVKHTGDGVAATFDGPARGITCACAIRDALRPLGLEVRAGLHTGEIERRGDDVSGVGVHIAARVVALAQPGEVLVSSTVKDLVVGSGIQFDDRGMHALKGVPDQWRLLSVLG